MAWRGTESFNGYDWSTDFDFSWYKLQGMGLVHIGFLEALGLVDRNSMESFTKLETNCAKVSKRSSHLSSPHLLKKKKNFSHHWLRNIPSGFSMRIRFLASMMTPNNFNSREHYCLCLGHGQLDDAVTDLHLPEYEFLVRSGPMLPSNIWI